MGSSAKKNKWGGEGANQYDRLRVSGTHTFAVGHAESIRKRVFLGWAAGGGSPKPKKTAGA